jgi:hypothetical protein
MTHIRFSTVFPAGLLAVVLAGAVWLWVRPERSDAPAIAMCLQLYRAATSHADSLRIDDQIPLQRTKGDLNPLTCGALRSNYPKRFAGP